MAFPLINASHQFFDSSGAPLVGGTLEFRSPSTDSFINSYPTADDADARTNANANPLTLDGRGGFTGLYLEDGVKYKIILKNAAGGTEDAQDDVLSPSLPWYAVATPEENAASVVPVNYNYVPGHLFRYAPNTDPGTTAMGAALANAYKSNSKVIIPGELLSIDNASEIALTANDVRVVCEKGAILDFTTNGMGLVISGTNVKWEGGHLRGTGAVASTATARNPSLMMVEGDDSARRNIEISGVKVSEANHSGIGVYRGVGVQIHNCVVEDDSGSSAVSRFGIWANDSARIDITDNTVDGFGSCIAGGGNSSAYTFDSFDGETGSSLQRGVIVSGNHCYNYADHAVYFSDWQIGYTVHKNYTYGGTSNPIKVQGDDVVVTDNICRNAGIGISGRASRRLVMTGNIVDVSGTGANVFGIRVGPDDPFNYDIEELIVSGNILRSTNATGAGHGIEIDGISNSTDYNIERLIVTDNIVEGYFCKLDNDPGGIYVRVGQLGTTSTNIDMARVEGNIIDLQQDHVNDNRGISLIFNANHVNVNGNLVRGFVEHGIYADGCNYINIDQNHLIGRAASTTNGIRTEIDCTLIRIGVNQFEDCNTNVNSPIALGAWRTAQRIVGSVAWNPANIAANARATTTVAIVGAAVDDLVNVTNSIDLQSLSLSAKVTSSDTVTLYIDNNTTGAVDLGTDNYFVDVFKRDD